MSPRSLKRENVANAPPNFSQQPTRGRTLARRFRASFSSESHAQLCLRVEAARG